MTPAGHGVHGRVFLLTGPRSREALLWWTMRVTVDIYREVDRMPASQALL